MSGRAFSAVRRSTGIALSWCRFYTRGVDARFASERADEISSDLHEHTQWAREAGQSPAETARQIRSRTLRGAGADLLWRHARLREGSPEALFNARVGSLSAVLQAVVVVLVLAAAAFGTAASIRLASEPRMPLGTQAPVYGATAVAVIALMLLLGRRTRTIGALLGMIAAAVLPTVAVDALWYVSATTSVLVASVPQLDIVLLLLAGAQALIVLAAVLCWSIERPPLENGASS